MTAPRSVSASLAALALVATVLASVGLVSAGAATAVVDPPTEDSTRVKVELAGSDYADMESDRCSFATEDGLIGVDCRRKGAIWIDYRFTVPEEAINLRPSFVRRVAADSPGDYARLEGHRTSRTRYQVAVNVAQGTKVVVEEVRLRYDLPTTVDDRTCVTPGEWVAVNPARGGTGGSRRQVAEVFDHAGTLSERSGWQSGYRYQVRSYPRCDSERDVRVTFHQYRDQPGWHSYWG